MGQEMVKGNVMRFYAFLVIVFDTRRVVNWEPPSSNPPSHFDIFLVKSIKVLNFVM
jgi:hypothetical protein